MKQALLVALALALTWTASLPAAIIYTNRTVFESELGTVITDDFGTAYPDGFAIYNNAVMSGFFNETDFTTTGFNNLNIHLASDRYCAGCNGSFRLSFATTSVTATNGVFGAGFDVVAGTTYVAYVTFGDSSTAQYSLPTSQAFWGITSPLEIQSIHLGLPGGASTNGGYLEIDNLTIGNAGELAAVPEPASLTLFGAGLLALGLARRKR